MENNTKNNIEIRRLILGIVVITLILVLIVAIRINENKLDSSECKLKIWQSDQNAYKKVVGNLTPEDMIIDLQNGCELYKFFK